MGIEDRFGETTGLEEREAQQDGIGCNLGDAGVNVVREDDALHQNTPDGETRAYGYNHFLCTFCFADKFHILTSFKLWHIWIEMFYSINNSPGIYAKVETLLSKNSQ